MVGDSVRVEQTEGRTGRTKTRAASRQGLAGVQSRNEEGVQRPVQIVVRAVLTAFGR